MTDATNLPTETSAAKRPRKAATKSAKKAPAKKAVAKKAATGKSETCSVAQIARDLGMSEKVARAKCRRHPDAFKRLAHVDGSSRWTFKASARPAIIEFLQG